MYGAIANLDARGEEKGIEIFERAIENVKPLLEVRSRRVGGQHTKFLLKLEL